MGEIEQFDQFLIFITQVNVQFNIIGKIKALTFLGFFVLSLDEVDGGELVEEADFDEKHLILGSIQLLIWVIKDLNGLIHALDGLLNLP